MNRLIEPDLYSLFFWSRPTQCNGATEEKKPSLFFFFVPVTVRHAHQVSAPTHVVRSALGAPHELRSRAASASKSSCEEQRESATIRPVSDAFYYRTVFVTMMLPKASCWSTLMTPVHLSTSSSKNVDAAVLRLELSPSISKKSS